MKIHMVKKGDSLYSIATKHGVTVEELLQLNPGITNPDVIDVGMKIKEPAAKGPAGDWMHQHKVVQGDTLWKLSKAWGIPLADMIKANPQLKNPNVLMTGEIINIPKAAAGAGQGAQGAPAELPGLTELQHIEGEPPVPGKAFTGVMPGKTPTAPIETPQPIEPEAVVPTPAPEPPPVPLPTPVEPPVLEQPKKPDTSPMPLPMPVEPPKAGYGVPAKPEIPKMPEQVIDLFKQFQVPAAEAFAPHAGAAAYPMPPAPAYGAEATAGVGGYPLPGLGMPAAHVEFGTPCPPGTVPLGVWAEAGAGPGVYAEAGVGMPGIPGMPGMPGMGAAAGVHEGSGGYGYGAPAAQPYGHGGHGMDAHVQGWPGIQAGVQEGYGMPHAHGHAGGYGVPPMGVHPAAGMIPMPYPPIAPAFGHGHPCPCGGYDPRAYAGYDPRYYAGYAGPAAGGVQAPGQESAQDTSQATPEASRKSGKKATIRSSGGETGSGGRTGGSGGGAKARIASRTPSRPQPPKKRGSRPWINR